MNRCMVLAAALFDRYRTPECVADAVGRFTTPGRHAELLRLLHPAQRELVLSPEPRRAACYGDRHGTASILALQRELVRNGRIAAEILG